MCTVSYWLETYDNDVLGYIPTVGTRPLVGVLYTYLMHVVINVVTKLIEQQITSSTYVYTDNR